MSTSTQPADKPAVRLDRRGKPLPRTAWRPGQTGNPRGRTREGASWSSVIREMSEMCAENISDEVGAESGLGQIYAKLPRGVALKRLVTARVLAALVLDPSPGLWSGLMERAEGRVPLAVDVSALSLSPEQIEQRISTILERARARLNDAAITALDAAASSHIDEDSRDE